MSIKRALYTYLSTHASVTALAGDRVYPEIIPDQVFDAVSKRPCVVYRRSSADRRKTFCGTDTLVASSFAVDCYARTYDGAETLAAAVRSALTDFRGDMSGITVKDVALSSDFDLLDLEPGLFRVSLGFDIWHVENL